MTMPTPRSIQRTYLLLLLGNTLAASLIWGINTIFLLDAGLSNLEAFAANAFFTGGHGPLRGPDRDRRRHGRAPRLLPAGNRDPDGVDAPLRPALANRGAVLAMGCGLGLLGLGFTFFSGAVEAWLVDALNATGFTGELESVFGRARS